jgi:ubiquinone/menaquinone biosynthesis C-methylase UbiE
MDTDRVDTFTDAEIREVLAHIEARQEEMRRLGFDSAAATAGILQQALPLPEPILEVATGKGRFLGELARHASHVVTLDCEAAEQRVARIYTHAMGVAQRISFLRADAARLPFADASFGAVVSMNTFHHLAEPRLVLEEMRRVVRPDGKIVISDFDEEGQQIMQRLHASRAEHHPRGACSMDQIAAFWKSSGWRVREAHAPCQRIVIACGSAASL